LFLTIARPQPTPVRGSTKPLLAGEPSKTRDAPRHGKVRLSPPVWPLHLHTRIAFLAPVKPPAYCPHCASSAKAPGARRLRSRSCRRRRARASWQRQGQRPRINPEERYLDPIGRSRRRCAQEPCFELLTVSAVVDPIARSREPLTAGNACGMADHTKTILGIVIRYALDEAPPALSWVDGSGCGVVTRPSSVLPQRRQFHGTSPKLRCKPKRRYVDARDHR
jgi:hypothetical protein